MKALFSYNLSSEEEMEEMVRFISRTYKDQDEPDIDDLLDGLGISLN